jgi:hypothetical protein
MDVAYCHSPMPEHITEFEWEKKMATRMSLPARATKPQGLYSPPHKIDRMARLTPWFCRSILMMATFVFTTISVRYIGNPIRTAAAFKITLGSPAAITNMRVGFGAFPLGFAIITFSCLISPRRFLRGLYFVMTIIATATAARVLGIVVDGPAAESLGVLRPELVMLTLSIVGIFLETRRRRSQANEGDSRPLRERVPA